MRNYRLPAVVGVVAAFAAPQAANAGGIVESCYQKSYVGAKYAYGKRLIRGQYRTWTNLDNGPGFVTRVRHPAVYVRTARKVADDHYILVPVACR